MNKIAIAVFVSVMIINTCDSHPGVGIVMDSKQNVFYTDLKQVWKITPDGKRSIAVENVHTHELYLDKHDNLFGEHLWYEGEASNKWGHYIWKLTGSGKIEKVVQPTEGFPKDYSFIRDETHMFIAERERECQRVVRKTRSQTIVAHSKGCLNNIRWMTRSKRGNIYLIDGSDLKRVTTNGEVEIMAASIAQNLTGIGNTDQQHAAMGLWTDNEENIYVAIYGGGAVKKVTQDKKVSDVLQTGQRWSPTGGLLADNGDFWLLECSPLNEVRVERITKGGARLVYGNN